MSSFHLIRNLGLCSGLMAAAWGQAPSSPAATAPPPAAPAAQQVAPANPGDAIPAAIDPSTFVIGAEDVLRIHVWKEPEITSSVVVRPDGKVSLPLVHELQAAGLTPVQFQEKLTEALSKYLNAPQVLVSVLEARSKKYYLSGNISRNGPVPLVTPTTILQAISAAGGFREFAKTKKIVIMRGDQRIKFNYKDVIQGKHPEQNILLQDGDHIYVP